MIEKREEINETLFQSFQKVIFANIDTLHLVTINDIISIESQGNYAIVRIENREDIMITSSLKKIEDFLHNYEFVRIHNSYIININKILNYIRRKGKYITMIDKTKIPVSRRRQGELLSRLNNLAKELP